MRREWKTGLLAMVLLAGGVGPALGDFAVTADGTATPSAAGSLGWRFFVNEPVAITALGLYDAHSNLHAYLYLLLVMH